ncbi:hypothetical protein [Comamonas aquatica]|uniref:hypothetical protein n=1 Tax=Comamonas aquatica TaxID=225991 RepID=UPI00391A8EB8
MATRKPLVMVGGKPQQLPEGDRLLGVGHFLPVGLAAGGYALVSVTEQATIRVGLALGGSVEVPVGV